jgi:hypothetical protein
MRPARDLREAAVPRTPLLTAKGGCRGVHRTAQAKKLTDQQAHAAQQGELDGGGGLDYWRIACHAGSRQSKATAATRRPVATKADMSRAIQPASEIACAPTRTHPPKKEQMA